MSKLILFLVFMALGFIIGAWLWTYTINTWLIYFHKAPVLQWWQGGLIGFVPWVGHASIPAAVVTWILMLFIR